MTTTSWIRTGAMAAALAAMMLVGGCQKISGTYQGTMAGVTMSIHFKSSDKADVSMTADKKTQTREISYGVNGDKITLHDPEGNGADLEATKESDGSLTGLGVKMTKQ